MPHSCRIRLTSVFVLFLLAAATRASAAETSSPDWLRGSGESLELRLRGEVLGVDGGTATDIHVDAHINSGLAAQKLNATLDGNSFEVWIPVNQPQWYSVWLRASSANGGGVAYETFNAYQLRQAAVDGLRLTLQQPTRQVTIKVTDQGEPVPGAHVQATLGFGIEERTTTDGDGIAQLVLLPQQDMSNSHLTAWTDDPRVGGFTFSRSPPRDPNLDEYTIELSHCRDQKVRFVTDDGSPVPDVTFLLQIATPSPHYNYIGWTDHSVLTTDSEGEAVYRWFPDWEQVHYYAEINDEKWFVEGDHKIVDGVAVFTLKPRAPRQQVTGRVVSTGTNTGPGGFYVTLRSFQGERENHSDITSAFSDRSGTFTVDVLPDATYCAYVQDEKWVGKTIDVLPYESGVDKLTPPELAIAEGQPVEVFVTSGLSMRPVSNLTVSFRREHRYAWHENGEERHGIGGPQWWATTDESGRATTRTLPGKLNVSIYTPRWRTEESIDVVAGELVKITLHREIDVKRTIAGRLVLSDTVNADLNGIDVFVGSLDDNYADEQSVTCDADGSFTFDTFAGEVGIFAATQDGQLAGSLVTKDLFAPIEIHLHPAAVYQGQVLGPGDQPAVSHPVYAYVRLEAAEKVEGAWFPKSFQAKRIVTMTDEHGNFTLRGIPSRTQTVLYADAHDGSDDSVRIGEFYFEPAETRSGTVTRLAKTASSQIQAPLAERYETTLRDCRLAGYRPLVLIADDREGVSRFVNKNYASMDTNPDVYAFMQILVTAGQDPLTPADAAFLEARGWPSPEPGRVFAYALDGDGNELGRQTINVDDEGAADDAARFVHAHAPPLHDAEEEWDAAFAEAERTNRRVWVRISQRYCGPCFRMSRWLDDQRELLEKDYVMLKIDDVRDVNGKDVAERVHGGERFGIPFHAIFDASGTMLIDSNGPLGNIGSPGGIEGQRHLRKMLAETRQNLTDEEIQRLVESVNE